MTVSDVMDKDREKKEEIGQNSTKKTSIEKSNL